MRFILGFFVIFFSLPSFALRQITTQIHDIDYGNNIGDEPLILLTSGDVAKLGTGHFKSLDALVTAKEKRTWVSIDLNDKREILSFKSVPSPFAGEPVKNDKQIFTEYIPSVAQNSDQARKLFRQSSDSPNAESQCFNRAHVWSHRWHVNHQFLSNKMWIFFNRKYIRRYNFEWWFHVAPYIHVRENGAVRERVMDVKYARGPLQLRKWTDIFMRNNEPCNVVQSYSEWANYPETGWCYIMKTSMFFYQPVDVEILETWGTVKTNWVEAELRQAYLEAFNIHF